MQEPVELKTFFFDKSALRVTFSAAGSIWALRFGSVAAYCGFQEQIITRSPDYTSHG